MGVGLVPLAVIGSIVIGLMLFVFVNRKTTVTPYVLMVNCQNDAAETAAMELVKQQAGKFMVKSKSVSHNGSELTLEVRLKDGTGKLVNNPLGVTGVDNAVLVSYNGEYYM